MTRIENCLESICKMSVFVVRRKTKKKKKKREKRGGDGEKEKKSIKVESWTNLLVEASCSIIERERERKVS